VSECSTVSYNKNLFLIIKNELNSDLKALKKKEMIRGQ
jgi:hypothetical protein